MVQLYLEDLAIGEVRKSREFKIEADDVIAFGHSFDPQPFHTDAEAAKASPFGGLITSGWHLAALAMRLCVELRSYGDTPVVGLGADELRWYMPVRPGDVVHVERELVEIIDLPDKPKRGTAKARVDLKNQRGELVMRMYTLASVPKRKVPVTDSSHA
jgi:acyl dehydratase